MAKFDFRCQKCGKTEERNVLYKDIGKQICECGGKMEKLFSVKGTVFQVRWGRPAVRKKVKKMGV